MNHLITVAVPGILKRVEVELVECSPNMQWWVVVHKAPQHLCVLGVLLDKLHFHGNLRSSPQEVSKDCLPAPLFAFPEPPAVLSVKSQPGRGRQGNAPRLRLCAYFSPSLSGFRGRVRFIRHLMYNSLAPMVHGHSSEILPFAAISVVTWRIDTTSSAAFTNLIKREYHRLAPF